MNNKNFDSTLLSPVMSSSLKGCMLEVCDKNSFKAKKHVSTFGKKASGAGYEISIDKVETSAGVRFERPKKGNEFVTASVSIKNTGKDFLRYTPEMFKIKGKNGELDSNRYYSNAYRDELDDGLLAGGGYDHGTVTFEKPIGSDLYLCFEP